MRGDPHATEHEVALVLEALTPAWQKLPALAAAAGVSERTTMEAVRRLRALSQALVESGNEGYRIGTPSGARLTARSLRRRAGAILEAARGLEWLADRTDLVAALAAGADLPRGNEAAA